MRYLIKIGIPVRATLGLIFIIGLLLALSLVVFFATIFAPRKAVGCGEWAVEIFDEVWKWVFQS